jgi:hypothetical protein
MKRTKMGVKDQANYLLYSVFSGLYRKMTTGEGLDSEEEKGGQEDVGENGDSVVEKKKTMSMFASGIQLSLKGLDNYVN